MVSLKWIKSLIDFGWLETVLCRIAFKTNGFTYAASGLSTN